MSAQSTQGPGVVSELGFIYLHFNDGNYQSLMRTSRPYRLELGYTRTMMAFLLFWPEPAHIVQVGLGGGSLAKFCYRNLPASQVTAIEIDSEVIALRRHFRIPDDDERLTIICADGADFVAEHTSAFDVLMVDGFDVAGQSPQLCSEAFYQHAHAALAGDGVLVLNFLGADPAVGDYLNVIRRIFVEGVVVVPSEDCSNSIVFALKGQAAGWTRAELQVRAAQMDVRFGLKFRRVAAGLAAASGEG